MTHKLQTCDKLTAIENKIDEVIKQLNESHGRFLALAISLGDSLIQAKLLLKGTKRWQSWLKSRAYGQRTAQQYMRLAREKKRVFELAKAQDIAHLTMTGAIALLKKPKQKATKAAAIENRQAEPRSVTQQPSECILSDIEERFTSAREVSLDSREATIVTAARTDHSHEEYSPSEDAASLYLKLTGHASSWAESDRFEHPEWRRVSEVIGDQLLDEVQRLQSMNDQPTNLSNVELATLLACLSVAYIRRGLRDESVMNSESQALAACAEVV